MLMRLTSALVVVALALLSLPVTVSASGMSISIPSTMTLATSTVEVEFVVGVTCDDLNASDSGVYVHLTQAKSGATGSESTGPLVCDSTEHTYTLHVFADQAPFAPGAVAASSNAVEYGQYNQTVTASGSATVKLVQGQVDVPAAVTTPFTQNSYQVEIGSSGTLQYRYAQGPGFGQATIPITINCTLGPGGYSPYVTVDLEAAHGNGVATGYSPQQFNDFPYPTCDGVARTYYFRLALQAGINPGLSSVCVYVETWDYSPQWPTRNSDGVRTVTLTQG